MGGLHGKIAERTKAQKEESLSSVSSEAARQGEEGRQILQLRSWRWDQGREARQSWIDVDVQKEAKRKPQFLLRVKPSLNDREHEKALKKIALRGTVQLFNAVRKQQKELQEQLDEAGPLDHKKDAVLNNINKRKFLDVLMSGERAKSVFVDNPVKREMVKEESDEEEQNDNRKKQWSVLR